MRRTLFLQLNQNVMAYYSLIVQKHSKGTAYQLFVGTRLKFFSFIQGHKKQASFYT